MKFERKSFGFAVKDISEEGAVFGYASVFGVTDRGGDVVERGAFASATGKTFPMLWSHDPAQPIGRWETVEEDDYGLKVAGVLALEVQRAREIHALMKKGVIDQLSIGYRPRKFEKRGNGRALTEIELLEISPVTFAMLPEARIAYAKSCTNTPRTIREWEAFLRDEGGLSHREAKAFCAGGFNSLSALRDEADEGASVGNLIDLLKTFGR